jgi:hypothetical protein
MAELKRRTFLLYTGKQIELFRSNPDKNFPRELKGVVKYLFFS